MRSSIVILLVAIGTFMGGVVGFSLRQNGSAPVIPNSDNLVQKERNKTGVKEVFTQLQDFKVNGLYTWNVGDTGNESLYCLVRWLDRRDQGPEQRVRLTIFNAEGEAIYEEIFETVMEIYESYVLRDLRPQLVLKVVYGSTGTYYLRIFDYRDGKILKLIGGKEGYFNVGAEIRPQFQKGVFPGREPYQILLIEGVGLASPVEKYTRVHRYRDNSYKLAGKFPTQKLDDHMEDLLKDARRR